MPVSLVLLGDHHNVHRAVCYPSQESDGITYVAIETDSCKTPGKFRIKPMPVNEGAQELHAKLTSADREISVSIFALI